MEKLIAKKWDDFGYTYDKWETDRMFLIGCFLFDNVMVEPEQVIPLMKKYNNVFSSNTGYAELKCGLVEIGDLWDEDKPIYMPYDKFVTFLDKWKMFLDRDEEPDILEITMDDQYNIEFSYEWDGVTKKI